MSNAPKAYSDFCCTLGQNIPEFTKIFTVTIVGTT